MQWDRDEGIPLMIILMNMMLMMIILLLLMMIMVLRRMDLVIRIYDYSCPWAMQWDGDEGIPLVDLM